MTIWISMMIFNVVEERENKYIIILYQYIYLFYLQYISHSRAVVPSSVFAGRSARLGEGVK